MRNKVAKRIKKLVYGEDTSPKARRYFRNPETLSGVSDENRQKYQKLKKAHAHNEVQL